MWNHRMFLLHGDAKYMDVVERVIYNGFLAGISLDGDKFFYPNPLSCRIGYRFNKGSEGPHLRAGHQCRRSGTSSFRRRCPTARRWH